ncbi:MAG: molybdate ABC transporter substrate-binding protein, partial [Planktomarina sp.]
MMLRILITLLCCYALPVCADPLVVFAASSMKAPVDEISARYGRETGQDVVVSYASSSVLARQIAFGAPADVFISANVDWMQYLVSEGAVAETDIRPFAANQLVIVGTGDDTHLPLNSDAIVQRLHNGRLGVPILDAVPLGQYAKQALTK